jgi:hypothetical protein
MEVMKSLLRSAVSATRAQLSLVGGAHTSSLGLRTAIPLRVKVTITLAVFTNTQAQTNDDYPGHMISRAFQPRP